jgi:hypothetical protein
VRPDGRVSGSDEGVGSMTDDGPLNEFKSALDDYRVLFKDLSEDFVAWLKIIAGGDSSQLVRRAMVRSYFALVEGTLYRMRRFALHAHALSGIDLGCDESVALNELSYSIDDKGDINSRAQFVPLTNSLRFTVKILGRALNQPLSFDYSDSQWQAFRASIDIRNRLTHPKNANDAQVSNDDIDTIKAGSDWFRRETIKFKVAIDDAIAAYAKRSQPKAET